MKEKPMKNTFSWMHLTTPNSGKAQSFYRQLFDWNLVSKEKDEKAPYVEIDAGGEPFAGITQDGAGGSYWTTFINVDDIHKYKEKAESLGAQIIVPITDLGEGHGSFCVFKDPTGAALGLWAPK